MRLQAVAGGETVIATMGLFSGDGAVCHVIV